MGLPVEVNNLMLGSLGGYTVGRSLRFRSSASAYLNRTPAIASNRTTWTWSGWVKRGILSSAGNLFRSPTSSPSTGFRFTSTAASDTQNDGLRIFFSDATAGDLQTTQVFRDPSAWYHIIVAVDTTQATASNRVKLYINGVQVTAFSTATYPTQNYVTQINNTTSHVIGTYNTSTEFFDGYLAEVNFIDGQALTPSSFGAYDTNGVWQPKKYSGTYGTNGFYLPFSNNASSTTIGYDFSGNNNNWTANNIDVTSNNYRSFTTVGTYGWTAPIGVTSVNYLVVAGGGGGGGSSPNYVSGGGGGGGGVLSGTLSVTPGATYTVTVGAGGTGGAGSLGGNGGNGGNSVFATLTAIGGGGGGAYTAGPSTGGSGGGGANNGAGQAGAAGTSGQGNSGGNAGTYFNSTSSQGGGGGGGAGAAGSNFNGLNGGAGGAGIASTITGSTVYYGGGGGGGAANGTGGIAGSGGGGAGGSGGNSGGANGTANTGGGGGGASTQLSGSPTGGAGGSGLVILSYSGALQAGTTYDSMIDSPTNSASSSNYAVLNPIIPANSGFTNTFSEANQNGTITGTGGSAIFSSITMSTGAWYWETYVVNVGAGTNIDIGICSTAYPPSTMSNANGAIGGKAGGYSIFDTSGVAYKANNNTLTAYGVTYTNGDTIMTAFDATNGKIWFGKNGTWMASGDPATAANPTFSSIPSDTYWAGFGCAGGVSRTVQAIMNFGQRPFSYTPPTGFNALNTYNLPAPSISNGAKHFDINLWSGTNSTLAITNSASMQPDFVWIKSRNTASAPVLIDSNRGITKTLNTTSTAAEETATAGTGITSLNSNGFTLGTETSTTGSTNQTTRNYVGWQWKAGGTGVTNTSGTITSTVSANPTAGFSVVTYTGNGTSGATIGHGLGVAPQFYITKSRSSYTNSNWCVYHESIGATSYGILNSTSAFGAASTIWNNTAPTSSVFSLGSSAQTNNSGLGFVAYCFSAVSGYSAFGKYTGNGSTDGPFNYLGFRPRWVMVKASSTGGAGYNWYIYDTSRDSYNVEIARLFPNLSDAESTNANFSDFLSNGFKLRSSDTSWNASGVTYIYAAFAESPFQISRAR